MKQKITKEVAECFRHGLILGLHSVRDAMAWIDTIVDAEPVPAEIPSAHPAEE